MFFGMALGPHSLKYGIKVYWNNKISTSSSCNNIALNITYIALQVADVMFLS